MTEEQHNSEDRRQIDLKDLELPQQLLWLADAPAFIDGEQVELFYDAIIRPHFKKGVTQVTEQSEFAGKLLGQLELGVELDTGTLLALISSWLPKLKVTGDGTLSTEGGFTALKSESQELLPIDTPQRQLEQLVLHYHFFQHDRLSIETNPLEQNGDSNWVDDEWVQAVPRGLVLIDFPPRTKFIPTYGEYGEHNVPGLVFLKLDGGHLKYPNDPSEEQKREYWKYFAENFQVQQAVEALESSGTGRLQVVDFRIPIDDSGRTLHLHIHPRGEYPTITFAYNMIRRGFEHGIRLVGTMRSEPDMNVLAIYEK